MRLVEGSIRRPITVFMATAAVAIFGLVAQTRLAVDLLPDISYPSLTVRTNLPDAAPGDVEQFVTRPVEEAAGVVPGLVRMHSISRPGQSEVTLEFQSGTRMDLASLSVREKLDLVTLPNEAERPAILRFDPALDPVLRYRLSGGGNMRRLRRIAEQTVKRDLEGVSGVAAVRVSGGEEEEIKVDVDAARLSAAGLSLADVTQRLRDESINLAGGSLTEGRSEYLVRAVNQFAEPAEIAEVILAVRDDGMVRVSDVATVSRGARDREVVARVGGEESVEIGIYKEGDANTVAVATAVQGRAKAIPLPRDLKLVAVADQSRFIRSAMTDVMTSAVLGGLLAVLVLYAFLRDLRTTLIIALAIPVSVLATFIVMFRFGVSFNLMSLGGLALSVGNLVDNSIVVLESIFRRREEGLSARDAARLGTGEVAGAVTASTFTTVAVFAPLVFVEGLAGQLIRDQALVITFSQVASLIVALTLVPTIYGILGRGSVSHPAPGIEAEANRPGRFATANQWGLFILLALPRFITWLVGQAGHLIRPAVAFILRPFEAGMSALTRSYPVVLRGVLARPVRLLGWSTLAFVASLAVGSQLPRNLFPPFTQGEFRFNVTMPPGTALHVTDHALEALAAQVRKDSRVKIVHTSAGQIDLAAFAGSALEANRGQISVVMKRADDRKAEDAVATVLRDAMDAIPGATYDYEVPSLFRFQTPIEVEIYAYDLDTLRAAGATMVRELNQIPGLTDVESSTHVGDPEVQITFDRARLAAMHLDPMSASRLVRNAVQGVAATQFNDLERKIDVRVRATEDERSMVTRLAQLEVGRNQGMVVPLGAVADIRVARGPGDIRRIGQQRTAVVTANLQGRDLASAADDIETVLAGMNLPPGVQVHLAGQNRELAQSFGSLRFALLLAVFLVYLVMACQFESLLHPFVVMFSMPLGVIGVVLALGLSFTSVSIMVLIGLVVLAGIVVNNAIVLVDYARELQRRGTAKLDALVEAGSVRLRPILMTTLTTVLGLVPLAFATGEGAELSRPLAVTLMGGLLFGTLLTLFVIPAVYSILDRSS